MSERLNRAPNGLCCNMMTTHTRTYKTRPLDLGMIDVHISHLHPVMTLDSFGNCTQALSTVSANEDVDESEISVTSELSRIDVGHHITTRNPDDSQCQGLPSLQTSSPRSVANAMPENILPIRPFPLLDFLQSDEFAFLQSIAADNHQGILHSYSSMQH